MCVCVSRGTTEPKEHPVSHLFVVIRFNRTKSLVFCQQTCSRCTPGWSLVIHTNAKLAI